MNDATPPLLKETATDWTRTSRARAHRVPTSGILYTLDELAKLSGVSRRFLEQEIKRGHLVVVRLSPRVLRVKASEWERFLDRSTSVSAS